MVTTLSSTNTSFVRKSAPIVALYWLENFLLTYWFMSEVFPTPESPRMITFKRTFFLDVMFKLKLKQHKIKLTQNIYIIFKIDKNSIYVM